MTIELTASVIVPTTILDTGAFTRSTTATYFDVDGVMQTAAIDVPRIGYDPVTHAHTGLILEGAATNLLTYSEQFDNAAWGYADVTKSANTIPAPDGATTAETLVSTITGGANTAYANLVTTVSASTTYTFSVYVKQGTSPTSLVNLYRSSPYSEVTGAITWGTTPSYVTAGGDLLGGTLTDVGGGWYRATLTMSSGTATQMVSRVYVRNQGSSNVTGHTVSVWGAQLEAGSVATSYIPTTSAAVTRAADVVTGSGLIYCTTAEPASGETLWNAATNYSVGTVVCRTTTHHLYENLIAGVDATLPENALTGATPRWLDLGATNKWSQFDRKIGTATTSTGNLTTVLTPGCTEGLALLDLVGRSADITVKSATGGTVVLSRTIDLDATVVESVYDWMFNDFVQKRNVLLTDLPGQYPNAEITVTVNSTTGAAIGVFAVGRIMLIGSTQYGAGAGVINFGKVADDGFGNRTWVEGEWANRVTLPLIANTSDFNRIHRQLADVRSTPCIYIGSSLDSMEPLVCYGVYRDLYITVPNYPTIALNLEIDGMNNA